MRVISGSARGTVLHSIEETSTRPTLDRVKESLFNIIDNKINDETVALDLFAGSGAIGIEFISRGAKETIFCDISSEAINMIKQNLEKTRFDKKAKIINKNYIQCLKDLNQTKLDIIYIDPPYKDDIAVSAIKMISDFDMLKTDGIIIIETDEKNRDIEEINNSDIKYKIYDLRKYGRANLIFLSERS